MGNYVYQCIECSEKEQPDFLWRTEKEARDHVKANGEQHAIFIKCEAQEFGIKVVDYKP